MSQIQGKEANSDLYDEDYKKPDHSLGDMVILIFKTILASWFGLSFIILLLFTKYSNWLQRSIMFMHFVRWPLRTNFEETHKFGIKGLSNFYVTSTDNVRIGVWHILPTSLVDSGTLSNAEALGHGEPIIVYMHGNSGTRSSFHRLELYKVLQKLNYHIVAFDYRSYGDSSDVLPTETGVVEDGKTVLRWVHEYSKGAPLMVWGHSLGTGISSHAVVEIEKEGINVGGIILESPFNNISDAIRSHPLSLITKHMLFFEYFFVQPIVDNGIAFKSDEHLSSVSIRTLILHAEDDWVVPSKLGRKLYRHLRKNRVNGLKTVQYIEFGAQYHYGHKYICHAPELPTIVR